MSDRPSLIDNLHILFRRAGAERHINVTGEIGKPILWDTGDAFNRLILFMHPIDFYWAEYGDEEPELAHTLVMAWIYTEIERKADKAIERIDKMYHHA